MRKLLSVISVLVLALCLVLTTVTPAFAEDPEVIPDASDIELVPEPMVQEQHDYNVSGETDGMKWTHNEEWGLDIMHGNVITKIGGRTITQDQGPQGSDTFTDYQFNINYKIGDVLYIAECTVNSISFLIGDQVINTDLTYCDDFELSFSETQYDGTVPWLDCDIIYKNIQVYPDTPLISTFDLKFLHHIVADWSQTDTKIEALFDFGNTKFYDPNNGNTEYDTGEPFAAEIHYTMRLTIAHTAGLPIIPTGYSDTSLEYNLTLDNGTPLTVSKLLMKNDFSSYDETGAHSLMGYSVMEPAPIAQVTHGFPNLSYKSTQSLKSDPEITVYHNRVTDNDFQNQDTNQDTDWVKILAICVTAVMIVGITVFSVRKYHR